MQKLKGKTALITGGCSGIGLATVERFAAEGARVLAVDIQVDKGNALEQRFDGNVQFASCDVRSETQLAKTFALAATMFDGIDIVFNNAGAPAMRGGVQEIETVGWDESFALLVRAPALGMKYATPLMKARGGGSIINTSSIAALQAGWGPITYSSAKAAVLHMTRCAAAELARFNIRVNAICPGIIATPIFGTNAGLSGREADDFAAMVACNATSVQPLQRAGLPQDIAGTAAYLASDDAQFVTGTYIVVDGGVTVGPAHSWNDAVVSPFKQVTSQA